MLDSPPLQADRSGWLQWVLFLETLDPAEPSVRFALERARRVLDDFAVDPQKTPLATDASAQYSCST